MEEVLKQILGKISTMEEGQKQLSKDILGLKEDISRLESKVDKIAGSGEEDTVSLIKLMDKKMDTLATKESITSLDSKFNLLNGRLFETENKVNVLTLAK